MLYDYVTWSMRHYGTLRRAHYSFPTCCIDLQNNDSTDHLISYLDTLMKTESQSIEGVMRRRRILFVGLVARMEVTRLPKCVMLKELVGSGAA